MPAVIVAWKLVKSMQPMMIKGWSKCKIIPQCFETVFQLQTRVKWLENNYSIDAIHIPMGKKKSIIPKNNEEIIYDDLTTVQRNEQYDTYIHDGEDELESTEQVAAECLSDELLAELLQSEEDQLY